MISNEMRGLQQFIGDIRACHSHDEEEKRVNKELTNIRQKFKGGSLNSYQKKKYVSKILFIYLLGYDIDFGHAEAVGLCGSTKFSEKQLGYLAASLLLQNSPELVRLIINQLKKDLNDSNMHFTSLALQCIANIGGLELTEAAIVDVWKVIYNKGSSDFVKKKAALTALSLYRQYPSCVPIREWIPQIKELLRVSDIGILMAISSFVDELCNEFRHEFLQSANVFIDRLADIVLEKICPADYLYYKIPAPWLQIKLLDLLRKLCPSNRNFNLSKLQSILTEIIRSHKVIQKNQQSNNTSNAIFLTAISLISDIMPDSEMLDSAIDVLHGFLVSNETNSRYLALENLTKLTKIEHCLNRIKKHKELIIELLRDTDTSVKKEAVDLLFAICDSGNYDVIVLELLNHLNVTEEEFKGELILKIAILAENFAKDISWYFTTVFSLIDIGGDDVANDVWFKAIHIAVNNLDIQEFAVRHCIDCLQRDEVSDSLLKVCAYIIGEYGHLLADKPGYFPNEQLNLIHKNFEISPNSTKVIMFTAYLKVANLFPQTTSVIQNIFKNHMQDLDVEIQQRSCEYYELLQPENRDMLQVVCDEMPEFNLTTDNLARSLTKSTPAEITVQTINRDLPQAKKPEPKNDLLDLFGEPTPAPNSVGTQRPSSNLDDLFGFSNGSITKSVPQKVNKVVDNKLLTNLLVNGEGLLYEDQELQLGIKSQYENAFGGLSLYIGNKSSSNYNNFVIDITNVEGLTIKVKEQFPNLLPAGSQMRHVLDFQALNVFYAIPQMTISYRNNIGEVEISTKLPVHLFRFQTALQLSDVDYNQRALKLVAPNQSFIMDTNYFGDIKSLIQKVTALKFSTINSDLLNQNVFTGASIVNCANLRIGILLKLILNQKVILTYLVT
eukprot:NODE_918_length_3055_cov_0.562585.p1 type:complete len:895 gc:universal NODE_918_length_3055_cov_0.562585:2780-96(-)